MGWIEKLSDFDWRSLPLLIFLVALNFENGKSSLLLFNRPALHFWNTLNSDGFSPYHPITKRQQMLSEYIILDVYDPFIDFSVLFYDPAPEVIDPTHTPEQRKEATRKYLQRHNTAKEYYWAFFNATGVIPSLIRTNTTTFHLIEMNTLPGNLIQYNVRRKRLALEGTLAIPSSDFTVEVPANSRAFTAKRIYLQEYTWGFLRWRLSYDPMVTWEQIRKDTSLTGNRVPQPSEFKFLSNPCIHDLFLYAIITRSPFPNGVNRVYTITPLANQTIWSNLTSSFCVQSDMSPNSECGSVTEVLITNSHLLAMSNLGLYVSAPYNNTVEGTLGLGPEVLPVLTFRLLNPCAAFKDFLHCFDADDGPHGQFIYKLELSHVPICHVYQIPNYRDTVILTIEHAIPGQLPPNMTGNPRPTTKGVTVLYASAPYTRWDVLIRQIDSYLNQPILGIYGIYYHYQLNQFDLVLGYLKENFRGPLHVRLILPMPSTPDAYYDKTTFGTGSHFRVFDFPDGFQMSNLQVFPYSMDVFFLGDQLFIAESGGTLVYTSVTNFAAQDHLEYCAFNHADRAFVCVNHAQTIILIGYVGSSYGMREVHASQVSEIKKVFEAEKWIASYPPMADSAVKSSYDRLNIPRYVEAFDQIRYTVSYLGTIQMWYMSGHELEVNNEATSLAGMNVRAGDTVDPALQKEFDEKLKPPKQKKRAEISMIGFDPSKAKFAPEISHGPLVPFLIDAITVVLYEALTTVPKGSNVDSTTFRYLSQVNIGNDIRCTKAANDGASSSGYTCSLHIRHIKSLHGRLPGFSTTIGAFIDRSIPMIAFGCDYILNVAVQSNRVSFMAPNMASGSASGSSADDCSCWKPEYVGWTMYIPGLFSVLIERSGPYKYVGDAMNPYENLCAQGIATTEANEMEMHNVVKFQSFLMDMSTPEYRRTRVEYDLFEKLERTTKPDSSAASDEGMPSWILEGGPCVYLLSYVENDVIKASGGHIYLDLQDSLSFKVKVMAENQKAQVGLERPLILISNTNPNVLQVDQDYTRYRTHQTIEITAKPTGFGIGISSLVIRTMSCSSRCPTPCSLTYIFQVAHREGHALFIHYPAKKEIHSRSAVGRNLDDYLLLPVNYRPPSGRGVDVPLSSNVYNVDPSKPKFKDWYRVTKETGDYKQCLNQEDRAGCGCTKADTWNDDPIYTDCKQYAFRVRRGKEVNMRITYPTLMKPARQNKKFFLPRQHLSVSIVEVNGRSEYSVSSEDDAYLREVNGDRDLNLGNKFYSADDLRIICFGTGLFHFKATLGDFDSFGTVTGHFVLYSEEFGIHDVTYLVVMFVSLSICFLLLFCGFVRVRKRLTSHLPIHGNVEHHHKE